jgi:hypothetical protein
MAASAKASKTAIESSVRTLAVLLMSSTKTYSMKLMLDAPNSLRSTAGCAALFCAIGIGIALVALALFATEFWGPRKV